MSRAEWLEKNEWEPPTRDLMVEVAKVAEEARAEGDLSLALGAKGVEIRIARMMSLQEHCVVAAAEVLEAWPELARTPPSDGDRAERRLVWGMKYAAGAAMDLPEIPLPTVDALVAALGEMLAYWGKKPYALWLLEARRAYIAGDKAALAPFLEKVPPTINRYTHYYEHTDCPGCAVQQLAEFLGPGADPEAVEAILAPVLEPGRRFPNEPAEKQMILDLLLGDDAACDHAKVRAPALFARTLASAGQWQRAVRYAKRAEGAAESCNDEQKIRAWLAAIDVARAQADAGRVTELASMLSRALEPLQDPYEQLDGLLAVHAALGALPPGVPAREGRAAIAARCRELAVRLDARLDSPHHAADVAARLA